MNKIKHILCIVAFLLNTNFANAKAGLYFTTPSLTLEKVLTVTAPLLVAATPYLFKDKDTDYSYTTTLKSTYGHGFAIPLILYSMRVNEEIGASSILISQIIGTIVGFNLSKSNLSNKNKGRKKFYYGIGIGVNTLSISSKESILITPFETGYGLTDNLVINFFLEFSKTKAYSKNIPFGAGMSYYINDNDYIQFRLGDALALDTDNGLSNTTINNNTSEYTNYYNKNRGSRFSIGYGKSIYKHLAVELNYTSFYFNNIDNSKIPTDTFSVLFNYRHF